MERQDELRHCHGIGKPIEPIELLLAVDDTDDVSLCGCFLRLPEVKRSKRRVA